MERASAACYGSCMSSDDEPFIRDDDFVPDNDEEVDAIVASTGLPRDAVFRALVAQDRYQWGMGIVHVGNDEAARAFAERCRAAAPDLFPARNVAQRFVAMELEASYVMRVVKLSADAVEQVLTAFHELTLG